MKKRSRRIIPFGAVLAGAVLAVVTAASPALATSTIPAATTPMPADLSCGVDVVGVNAQNQVVWHHYRSESGRATLSTETWSDAKLGFTPRALTKKESNGAGSANALGDSGRDFYATATNGDLYVVGFNIDGTISKKVVNSTWAPVRLMTAVPAISGTAGAYVYAIHDSGALYRYNTPAAPQNMTNTTFVSSGWSDVKTLVWIDRKFLPNGAEADVLLATLKTGQLVEYTIPTANPTNTGTRTDVRPSTWEILTSVTVGSCFTVKNPGASAVTPFIGTLSNGEARLYVDKNIHTPAYADIVGYNQIDTGWGTTIFSSHGG